VVCFRHLPGGRAAATALAPEALDAHQERVQATLERDGRGWVTITRLRGRAYLRAGVVNTQATEADADALLDLLRELAASL
jgi:glutamate/tyrosine decarboxylase-like PLP-dependent enzyme